VCFCNAVNATLFDELNFNFIRDIAPVASISREANVLLVHPSVPGRLNMATAGNGSPGHVFGELFKFMAGLNILHVPHGGGRPAITDLLAALQG